MVSEPQKVWEFDFTVSAKEAGVIEAMEVAEIALKLKIVTQQKHFGAVREFWNWRKKRSSW